MPASITALNIEKSADSVSGVSPPSASGRAPQISATPHVATARTLPISAGYRARVIAVLMMADVVTALVALFSGLPPVNGHEWAVWLAVACATVGLLGVGYTCDLYDAKNSASLRRAARAISVLGVLVIGVTMLAVFGLAGPVPLARMAIVGSTAVSTLVLLRVAAAMWVERHTAAAERLLLIGTAEAVARLFQASQSSYVPERFVGMIAIGDSALAPIPALAAFDPLSDTAGTAVEDFWRIHEALRGRTRAIDRVIIVASDLDEAALAAVFQRVEHLPFEIAVALPLTMNGETSDLLDRDNCLTVRGAAITPWGLVAKRALDIVAASTLLVLLGPALLVIAALIKLTSPGPALFRQQRWGWNNEPFTVFKFRTMWVNAPGADGSIQAVHGDSRITPVGALLRSTSLDEFPQLLNVLNGTMSLVGPRPHPVELNLRYIGVIERYAGRHRIAPGITGLAQVMGYRGETRSASLMQKRVDFDLEYIRTRSLGSDIGILFRTVISVIRGVNAY